MCCVACSAFDFLSDCPCQAAPPPFMFLTLAAEQDMQACRCAVCYSQNILQALGLPALLTETGTGLLGTSSVAQASKIHSTVMPAGKAHLECPVGLHSVKLGKAASLQTLCLQRSWTADGRPLHGSCRLLMGLLSHHCGLWK